MAEIQFSFQKFIDDSKNVLIAPKDYFASMPKGGGLGEPLVKAVLYGAIAGVVGMIWAVAGIGAVAGPMGSMIGGGIGIMMLIGSIIGAVIGLFIGAVIILIISAISKGSTDFESCARVAASLMVLMPINIILSVSAVLPWFIGSIVTLGVMLYGLYMMYHGLTAGLGGSEGTAKVISLILAVIPVLMILSTIMCASAIKSGSEQWKRQGEAILQEKSPEMERALKQFQEMNRQLQVQEETE